MEALAGIKVVDFSWGIAGPVTAEKLAEMGAEVIKVESKTYVDPNRLSRDPMTGEYSGVNQVESFNSANLCKLGVTLNLKNAEALELAKKLIERADVMIESAPAGVMERLGLGYETVKEINPGIVMLSTSGHGHEGPEAHYVGYAPLFTASAGVGEMTGYFDSTPAEIRESVDYVSALHAIVGLMAALIHRKKTGEGQHIDLSSREVMVGTVGDSLMDYFMNGRVQTRHGNEDEVMSPHNCYRCKGNDSWVSIAVSKDSEWAALCKAMGNPELEKRFSDAYSRWTNRELIDKLVESWTVNYTDYEVMDTLQKVGIAAVPSFNGQELLSDPHLKERGAFQVVEHPEAGARFIMSPPWRLSLTPPTISHDAPLLGEHNRYVFGQLLGLSQETIDKLIEEKAIY